MRHTYYVVGSCLCVLAGTRYLGGLDVPVAGRERERDIIAFALSGAWFIASSFLTFMMSYEVYGIVRRRCWAEPPRE